MEGGGAALPVPAIVEVMRAAGATVRVFALVRRDGLAIAPLLEAKIDLVVRGGGEKDHVAALRWLNREIAAWQPTHLWTSLTRATLLGQLVGAYRRIPVISWQHAAFLKPANLRLLRLTQRLSCLWVGDSETVTKLTSRRLAVPRERLAEWPIFRADAEVPRAAPWKTGETLRIGSLGRLHPVKGYDVLIEALSRLSIDKTAISVEVAGEGAQRPFLEERAAACPGLDIVFSGYCEDPLAFLAGLHLYVQPSRSEGLCIAAHEAMQAGLPVIASAVGELPASITSETGCLVSPGDPAQLASALDRLLAHPERLASMGNAGRSRVLERFGRERFEAAGRAVLKRIEMMTC